MNRKSIFVLLRDHFQWWQPEAKLFIVFIATNLLVDSFRPYLLLTILLVIALYFISKQPLRALWLSFWSVFLLQKARLFEMPFGNPDQIAAMIGDRPYFTYFVLFSDGLWFLLGYWLITRHQNLLRQPFSFRKHDYFLLAFVGCAVVTSWLAALPWFSWFWVWQLIKLITVYFFARSYFSTLRLTIPTLQILLIYLVFSAIVILFQQLNGGLLGLPMESQVALYGFSADESPSLIRQAGIVGDPNLASSLLALGLPFSLYLSLKTGPEKIFGLLAFAFLSLAILFTASRAVWLISIAVIAAQIFVLNKYQLITRIQKSQLNTLLAAVGVIFVLNISLLVSRLGSLSQTITSTGGLSYRLAHISLALDLTIIKPWGHGLNSFQYVIVNTFEPDRYFSDSAPAHNILAEILADVGVVGLISWLGFTILSIWFGWRRSFQPPHPFLIAVLGSVIIFLACAQTYPWTFSPLIGGVYWLLLGVLHEEKMVKSDIL